MGEPPIQYHSDTSNPRDRAVARHQIEELLRAAIAVQRGHFVLDGGRHSEHDLELQALVSHPATVAEIAQILAMQSLEMVRDCGGAIDLVVGLETSGTRMEEEIGRCLGVHGFCTEEAQGTDGIARRVLQPGAHIPPRARVLLVDGVFTSSEMLQAFLPTLYAAGAHPIAAAVVVNRLPEIRAIDAEGREPIPLIAGITLEHPTYEEAACPLCAAGEPIGAKGSSSR